MPRPNLTLFQLRLRDCVLGHGTSAENAVSIRKFGLTQPFNYACVDEGWGTDEVDRVNVRFPAADCADRTYPDPEGHWGNPTITAPEPFDMQRIVEKIGMEEALNLIERYLTENPDGYEDATDPRNYNLVIVGPVLVLD